VSKLAKVSATQVNKHLKVVDVFRALDPTMPIGQVKMFLEAAKNEQSTLSELAERSGLALATASHYLTNMMVMDRYKKKGLDVLDAYENPMNRRQKLVVLTERGRKLIDQLNGG
jgi:DNA-binding MarR family transcriptional regulator